MRSLAWPRRGFEAPSGALARATSPAARGRKAPSGALRAPPPRYASHQRDLMIATVLKLIARRLLAAIPILLIVSALLFCVLRVLPVDPAAMSLPPTAGIAEVE